MLNLAFICVLTTFLTILYNLYTKLILIYYYIYYILKNIFQSKRIQGDSGGPLQCQRTSPRWGSFKGAYWHLDGVTSFGEGCGRGIPGGYTRVTNYIRWIRRHVGERAAIPR